MANLDYYRLLGISRNASQGDIKVAYHRTLLQSHPDKQVKPRTPGTLSQTTNDHPLDHDIADIALIKAAYTTLIDPALRKAYDVRLARDQSPNDRAPRPAQVVSLEEFIVHNVYADGDDAEQEWRYGCRCGGVYCITGRDLELGRHLVGCQSCSEVIWVGYELVED
ncbi:hypothetical protein ID866_7801 [Astraeus odoratus]|nr:hypothetical protein ID866_7801 [Astraeus odoratus]